MTEEETMPMAEIAYNAYCDTTDWKSAVTGDELPPFNVLPPHIKTAWASAADAVWAESVT